MPGPNCFLFSVISDPLPLAFAVSFDLLAYIGLGPGQEFIPYFSGLALRGRHGLPGDPSMAVPWRSRRLARARSRHRHEPKDELATANMPESPDRSPRQAMTAVARASFDFKDPWWRGLTNKTSHPRRQREFTELDRPVIALQQDRAGESPPRYRAPPPVMPGMVCRSIALAIKNERDDPAGESNVHRLPLAGLLGG